MTVMKSSSQPVYTEVKGMQSRNYGWGKAGLLSTVCKSIGSGFRRSLSGTGRVRQQARDHPDQPLFLRISSRFLLACCLLPCPLPLGAEPCDVRWDQTIGMPGLEGTDGGSIVGRALAVFDDGYGKALYAGGIYLTAGGSTVSGIARWDGTSWRSVGGGVENFSRVYALIVFDDGNGDALYAAGSFTRAGGVSANAVARWDGLSWSALGDGLTGGFFETIIFALAVYDDGTGPAIYAAGRFTQAGDVPVNHIARWDGSSWFDVGGGLEGMHDIDRVNALCVYDDGNGPGLYAGGMFTGAGGVESMGIARWDGNSWSDVGGGMNRPVRAFTVFDDGTGPALYVGGNFWFAGAVRAVRVARWDGQTWSSLGEGFAGPNPWVTSLIGFDDGNGAALYAGGKFTLSGDTEVNRIARWSGSEWVSLGNGMNDNIYGLGVFDDGSGSGLYAIGRFTEVEGVPANHIAKWGCSPVRTPYDFDLDGDVDLTDYSVLVDCLSAPGAAPAPTGAMTPAECQAVFDPDQDRDIDLHDFYEFQVAFSQ